MPRYGFINSLLWRLVAPTPGESERGFEALELVLKAGARMPLDDEQLKSLRRQLVDGESKTVIRLLGLLQEYKAVTPEQFHELTRTPAMQRVLKGISKPQRDIFGTYYTPPPLPATPPMVESPRRGYWRRHW